MGATPRTLLETYTQAGTQSWLQSLLNDYYVYGFFWWMTGLTLYAAIYAKTKNSLYAGTVLTLYLALIPYTGMVTVPVVATSLKWGALIVGISLAAKIYSILVKR